MTSRNGKNRLSPPLMYAFRGAYQARDARKPIDLRDESGERVIAGRKSSARAAITEPLLRREVLRDLEQLMNTIALESSEDISDFPEVRRSILNYGFPDVVHRSADEERNSEMLHEIQAVLTAYEPRLVRDSILVRRDPESRTDGLTMRFLISADLACEPLNVPVEFVAEVEVDSAKIRIATGRAR